MVSVWDWSNRLTHTAGSDHRWWLGLYIISLFEIGPMHLSVEGLRPWDWSYPVLQYLREWPTQTVIWYNCRSVTPGDTAILGRTKVRHCMIFPLVHDSPGSWSPWFIILTPGLWSPWFRIPLVYDPLVHDPPPGLWSTWFMIPLVHDPPPGLWSPWFMILLVHNPSGSWSSPGLWSPSSL